MNDTKHTTTEALSKQAQQTLDAEVNNLDSRTLQRLQVARMTALHQDKKRSISFKWLTGAGVGLAFACLMAFLIVPGLMQSNSLTPFDDLELLTSEAELDVVTHLEFYEWLDASLDGSSNES